MPFNEELLNNIIQLLRQNKKQRDIATITGRHYNTIYRYVKHIRNTQIYEDQLTVNKIDNRLNDEMDTMSIPQLLTWRGQLVPSKVESKEEVTVKQEEPKLDLRNITEEEREEIRQWSRRMLDARADGAG